MKIFLLLAMALCAHALDIKMESEADTQKDKRQTQDELVHTQYLYRPSRKQEQVAPVEENQEDDKNVGRAESDEYRPGQVFSLNAQELLELQPERKAPVSSNQQLQQLYSNPQPEHKQNLQQFYYLEPQTARQVSLQPSHAVIARPHYSANGGEASVGAALSVSDNGVTPSHSFDQDLLALLGHVSHAGRQEEARQQAYSHAQQAPTVTTQSVAPTYQQVDRYITKPSKKPTKLRSKVQIAPPQLPSAPQQYLIETTNVQQQQQHQPQQQQASHQQQYHAIPQSQRPQIRYVPIQPQVAIQQYEGPESQGLKVVPPPKLQQLQPHPQLAYRIQYQQPEATPKQYRIIEAPRIQQQPHRQEQGRSVAPERPVTYLKRFPEPEKLRSVKIYDEAAPEGLSSVQQQSHAANDQYYIRPVYKTTQQEQQNRYQVQQFARAIDPTKPPLSAIYVSKNVVPKKVLRPLVRVDQAKLEQPHREHAYRIAQPSNIGQASTEQQGQNPEEQRVHLPPPRNNKAYTPEEFAALVAAGYSVTPVPVGPASHQVAQSRSSIEPAPQPLQRRPLYSRRHQYLPLRSDEAP